ncbi:hypothetical protein JNW90_10075 [Micromonospora sp. STR1s_5]|nr:hypothetical protein [Micromonospora sp. STR1s_5]
MVGVATDESDVEQHLLLSTRTLRPQTVMDYGIDMHCCRWCCSLDRWQPSCSTRRAVPC